MTRFSILTTVFDPPLDVLAETIESVQRQSFGDWHWVIVDDGSANDVVHVLRTLAADEARVELVESSSNGGIVVASNAGLDRVSGDFVVLLDHDDVLADHALATVDRWLRTDTDYLYSDEGLLGADGTPGPAFYKPDWSPERLRSTNYCSHLSVLRASAVRDVGGFRSGFDGAQDHDLVLRVTERGGGVVHVPEVLYWWRQVAGSVAGDRSAKPYAYDAGRRAVAEHCARVGIDAAVGHGRHLGTYEVIRSVPDVLTSVIIPTAGSTGTVWGIERTYFVDAVRSVTAHTSRHIEFVLVTDESVTAGAIGAARRAAGGNDVRVVPYVLPFNFSDKVNLGAVHASGEVLLVLNDDVEVISDEFLDPLIPLALEPGVGAAGCMLLFDDGRIQHAGHVYSGSTRHIFFGHSKDEATPGHLLAIQRECIGVTAACLAVSAAVFAEIGGFSPLLPSNFNDVDFCLKLQMSGRRVVWTPFSELFHFESATRNPTATVDEWAVIERRWGTQVATDPYWNPNLEPNRDDWVERALR